MRNSYSSSKYQWEDASDLAVIVIGYGLNDQNLNSGHTSPGVNSKAETGMQTKKNKKHFMRLGQGNLQHWAKSKDQLKSVIVCRNCNDVSQFEMIRISSRNPLIYLWKGNYLAWWYEVVTFTTIFANDLPLRCCIKFDSLQNCVL